MTVSDYAARYQAEVRERMEELRRERPDEDNWIGYVTAEHEVGECVECDAHRALAVEGDDASDAENQTEGPDER
jgi:hypothetical protein